MIAVCLMLAAGLAQGGGAARVAWEASPEAAAEKAAKEGKLVLVVHLSGDFDDPDRT